MRLGDILADPDFVGVGTCVRTRYAEGTTVNGVFTRGAASTASIVACVQPVSGADLQALPEGRRIDEIKVVLTPSELRPRDRLAIGSDVYEVDKAETWQAFGETHYKAICSRRTK